MKCGRMDLGMSQLVLVTGFDELNIFHYEFFLETLHLREVSKTEIK